MIELNLKLISYTSKIVFLQVGKLEEIHSFLCNQCNLSADNYYLRCKGNEVFSNNDLTGSVQVIPRLRGGKGGFGSMLRAIGAQIEKTTNREACRDLSGRRLRDINEEQRLKKWISQQAEREREIEERKKKKLEKLSSEPKHEFQDESYFMERSEMPDKLNDAFEQGVQASTSNVKRKVEDDDVVPTKKKKKLILDFDEFSSSDDTEEEGGSDVSQNKQESNIEIFTTDKEENKIITSSNIDKNLEAGEKDNNTEEKESITNRKDIEDTTNIEVSTTDKDDNKVNTLSNVEEVNTGFSIEKETIINGKNNEGSTAMNKNIKS